MHCSANQQIIDNSFGWRVEGIARERQHQAHHHRAADHQWIGFKLLRSPRLCKSSIGRALRNRTLTVRSAFSDYHTNFAPSGSSQTNSPWLTASAAPAASLEARTVSLPSRLRLWRMYSVTGCSELSTV